MGNNNTREARRPDTPSTPGHHEITGTSSHLASHFDRVHSQGHATRSGRGGRPDILFLGVNSASNPSLERRETKQEREARKLEKERQARIKEREKSLREESVDGGYLVTMGVYTGTEDFNKSVVRQLIIERRMAPFWKGLSEFSESWNEDQLIAAVRGLSIPANDDQRGKESSKFETGSLTNLSDHNPFAPKSPTINISASDTSASLLISNSTLLGADPSSPTSLSPLNLPPSQVRPRSKTLASLTNSSQLSTPSEIVPREIDLPRNPNVNGQPIEIFLYKDPIDCPICFLSYPPYLNKTRCCDQPVCSECFVQIKRPDPHPPEHHDPSNQTPQDPVAEAEALVSEPACCPYCQQPEFGVIYEPPAFRTGLCYSNSAQGTSANFSDSLLSPNLSPSLFPTAPSSQNFNKRRTTSISANASTVITTDRIRPDWAIKLANARSYLARSSAAATALHTAAYLMGNNSADSRNFGIRSSRLSRIRGASASVSGASSQYANDSNNSTSSDHHYFSPRNSSRNEANSPRHRMQDIEELMMTEAIRLSIAAEEERKKKAEKEALKEVKRKVKEEKKREKREKKSIYGGTGSSASGSALNLGLPSLGRGRGNSVANFVHQEVASGDNQASNCKGKEVENRPASFSHGSAPINFSRSKSIVNWNPSGVAQCSGSNSHAIVDINYGVSPSTVTKVPNLCPLSDTSSPTSSFDELNSDYSRNNFHGCSSPHPDSISINGNPPKIQLDDSQNNDNNNVDSPESNLTANFQSLTAMMEDDHEIKRVNSSFHSSAKDLQEAPNSSEICQENQTSHGTIEGVPRLQKAYTDYSSIASSKKPPEVIILPGSPDAVVDKDASNEIFGKKFG